jgi:ABC-type transport system involved in multi-copper enzyme maturation permease subunit
MTETQHRGIGASLRRVRLIAGQTLGEAVRLQLTLLLGAIGAGLVLASLWLREFNFGSAELGFLGDLGLGAIGSLGTLLAALVTAQLFFNEVAGGVALCVLTRPVRRWEYVWGKFGGIAALLAIFTSALGSLILALVAWRAGQLGQVDIPVAALVCSVATQWLKLTLVAAMTLLVCSYAGTALFASSAGLLLAVAGHLRPFADAGAGAAWLRIWPNLALFDAESIFAAGQPPTGAVMLGLAGYWLAYVLLFGVGAAVVFKRREF